MGCPDDFLVFCIAQKITGAGPASKVIGVDFSNIWYSSLITGSELLTGLILKPEPGLSPKLRAQFRPDTDI